LTDELAQLHQEYLERGDRAALVRVVALCAERRQVIPDWAALALVTAIRKWDQAEARTMDEALGVERPRRWHQDAARRQAVLQPAVIDALQGLSAAGVSLTEDTFEQVAERFQIGATLVKRYWRQRRENADYAT
jgi:hypothetical protein